MMGSAAVRDARGHAVASVAAGGSPGPVRGLADLGAAAGPAGRLLAALSSGRGLSGRSMRVLFGDRRR